jgi:hypothetical protein
VRGKGAIERIIVGKAQIQAKPNKGRAIAHERRPFGPVVPVRGPRGGWQSDAKSHATAVALPDIAPTAAIRESSKLRAMHTSSLYRERSMGCQPETSLCLSCEI